MKTTAPPGLLKPEGHASPQRVKKGHRSTHDRWFLSLVCSCLLPLLRGLQEIRKDATQIATLEEFSDIAVPVPCSGASFPMRNPHRSHLLWSDWARPHAHKCKDGHCTSWLPLYAEHKVRSDANPNGSRDPNIRFYLLASSVAAKKVPTGYAEKFYWAALFAGFGAVRNSQQVSCKFFDFIADFIHVMPRKWASYCSAVVKRC